ncbi:MAG: hypothetical protein ACUVV6_04280 [Thermoplasmatota archaeon]
MSEPAASRMAFEQAAGWAGRISNEYFNSWALFELVRGLYEAAALSGETVFSEQAERQLERIKNPYFRILARCESAKSRLENGGRRRETRGLVASLEREVAALDKDHSRASALCECAELRERLGDAKGSERDLQEAQRISDCIENPFFRSWARSGLVRSAARVARYTGSPRLLGIYRSLASKLEDKYLAAWSWAEIARALNHLGDREGARASLESAWVCSREVRDPVNASIGMAEVARAALELGDPALAQRALEETCALLETSREHQRSLVLSACARMLAGLGDIAGAKRRIQDAIDAAQQISYDYFRSWALSGVVCALVCVGLALLEKPRGES